MQLDSLHASHNAKNLANGGILSSPLVNICRSSELHALRSTIQLVLQPLLLQLGQEAVLAGGKPLSRGLAACAAAAKLRWRLAAARQQLRQGTKPGAMLLRGQGQLLRLLRLPFLQITWQQVSWSSLHACCGGKGWPGRNAADGCASHT